MLVRIRQERLEVFQLLLLAGEEELLLRPVQLLLLHTTDQVRELLRVRLERAHVLQDGAFDASEEFAEQETSLADRVWLQHWMVATGRTRLCVHVKGHKRDLNMGVLRLLKTEQGRVTGHAAESRVGARAWPAPRSEGRGRG